MIFRYTRPDENRRVICLNQPPANQGRFIEEFPAFTIAIWAKLDGEASPIGEESIISFGSVNVDMIGISYHVNEGRNLLRFTVGAKNTRAPVEVQPIPDGCVGRWCHYALSYDQGVVSGFVNGRAVARQSNVTVRLVRHTAGLGIHWWDDGAGVSTRFLGAIKEVRIYDRALSPDDIADMAQAP